MFWGLIMEPHRRYTQKVKKSFHISMAAIDVSTSSTEPAQVMCGFEGRNYLLCTLRKPDMLQCPLNLNFEVGSEVSFAANGKCHIHLTGYLNDELVDIDEEVEEEEEVKDEETVKSKKRSLKSIQNGPHSKKSKKAAVSSTQGQGEENEDSNSDDSDYLQNLLGKSLEEEEDSDAEVDLEGEEEEAEEEEDEEDEDLEEEEDGEEEEEDDSDEEEESLSDEEKKIAKPKINGVESQKKKKKEKQNKEKVVEQNKKVPQQTNEQKNTIGKENQKKKTLQGGVIIEEIRVGQGAPAKNGRFVNVYYEGRLKQNNKMFDSATKGAGFSFRLGNGEVIKGWDVGVAGMKIGGKRRITCPPAMAYGQKGSPPEIPPNSTLVFDVELRKVN